VSVTAQPEEAGIVATKAEVERLVEMAAIPGRRAETLIRVLEGDRTLGARLFAPSYREHKPWRAQAGRKTFRAKTVFPDLKTTVEDAFEAGDRVVVRWRVQGTHKGRIAKIKPTGNKVNFTGITIYRFAGGRIVESWGQADVAQLASNCREIGPQIYEFLAAVRTAAPRPVAPRPTPRTVRSP
jgi:predicted ester cyclase